MSFWANVLWPDVHLVKRLMGKRLMGKCLMGQMPNGQMSIWVNVVESVCNATIIPIANIHLFLESSSKAVHISLLIAPACGLQTLQFLVFRCTVLDMPALNAAARAFITDDTATALLSALWTIERWHFIPINSKIVSQKCIF
jgi:hypothetical protein